MVNTLLQLLGVITFCAYMGSIYHLSRVLLCTRDSTRHALYWVLPIVVSAVLFKFMGVTPATGTEAATSDSNPLFAMLVVGIGPIGLHALMATFVFRCRNCGLAHNTYKVWWRKGTYWCPKCNTRYQDGKLVKRS